MSLTAEATRAEVEVEKQCGLILKTDSEFWEIRNKAILALTDLVIKYEKHPSVQDIIGMNVFRILKEPVKVMISDLRSQQVRDTCTFLTRLSQAVGDHMRHFLRDSFAAILDGVKVPNKVMSGYVDECIMNMIKNTTFKTGIHILVNEIKESKAKIVRERALVRVHRFRISSSETLRSPTARPFSSFSIPFLTQLFPCAHPLTDRPQEYINEILVHWDLQDKDIDPIAEAIKIGLEDASVRGREIARLAYLNLFQSFPRKTDKLKAGLSSASLRAKLAKQEEQHMMTIKQQEKVDSAAAAVAVAEAVNVSKTAPCVVTTSPLLPDADVSTAVSPVRGVIVGVHIPSLEAPVSDLRGITPTRPVSTPGKISLRVRRQSCQEEAITSIQAIIRGTLTRRQSLSAGSMSPIPGTTPRTSRLSSIESPSLETLTIEEHDLSAPLKVVAPLLLPSTPSSHSVPTPTSSPKRAKSSYTQSPQSPLRQAIESETKLGQSSQTNTPTASPSRAKNAKSLPAPIDSVLSTASPSKLEALTLVSSSSSGCSSSGIEPLVGPADDSSNDENSKVVVGMTVRYKLGSGSDGNSSQPLGKGIVRFVGLTSFAPGTWVGVEVLSSEGMGADSKVPLRKKDSKAVEDSIFIRADQIVSILSSSSVTNAGDSPSKKSSLLPPWLPTSTNSPKSAPFSPYGKLNKGDVKKRAHVAGLLKLKMSHLMGLMQRQLDIADLLEQEGRAGEDLVAELVTLTDQEAQLLGNFQDRLKTALR